MNTFKKFLKDSMLTEADIFPDVDVIKLDPDRADPYDVAQALMPTLVRMAYVYLTEDKVKYERTHRAEDDTPFEFTSDALDERLETLIDNICKRLDDMSTHDRKAFIDRISKEFKEKLTEAAVIQEQYTKPVYSLDKKEYKTVSGFTSALLKKHPDATFVSSVNAKGEIALTKRGQLTPIAIYKVSKPELGKPMIVTRL